VENELIDIVTINLDSNLVNVAEGFVPRVDRVEFLRIQKHLLAEFDRSSALVSKYYTANQAYCIGISLAPLISIRGLIDVKPTVWMI
jgi:hypothetical protein